MLKCWILHLWGPTGCWISFGIAATILLRRLPMHSPTVRRFTCFQKDNAFQLFQMSPKLEIAAGSRHSRTKALWPSRLLGPWTSAQPDYWIPWLRKGNDFTDPIFVHRVPEKCKATTIRTQPNRESPATMYVTVIFTYPKNYPSSVGGFYHSQSFSHLATHRTHPHPHRSPPLSTTLAIKVFRISTSQRLMPWSWVSPTWLDSKMTQRTPLLGGWAPR